MPWIVGLAVVGTISLIINPILALFLFILTGYLGFKESKRKAVAKQREARLASFVKEYGFNPNNQELNLVIEKLNKLKEIELDISNFTIDVEKLQSKLQNYIVNLGKYLKRPLALEEVNEALNSLELTVRQRSILAANKASLVTNIETLKKKIETISKQINDLLLKAEVKSWDEYLKLREAYFANKEQENRLNALSENFKDSHEKLHEIMLDEEKWQQKRCFKETKSSVRTLFS